MEQIPSAASGRFRKQYFELLDPDKLHFPPAVTVIKPEVQAELYETMFNADKLSHPPPSKYQIRVLKALLARIEEAVADPDEDVGFPPQHSHCSFPTRFH
jgi:protein-lysine N-methyltransferase EEF2KMT